MTWIEQQIDRLMRGQPAGFREVLTAAFENHDGIADAIEALEEVQLESEDDGRLTVQLLRRLPLSETERWASPLQTALGWIEDAEPEAADVLRGSGMPELIRIYDVLLGRLDHDDSVVADLLAVLKTLATYGAVEGRRRFLSALVHPDLEDAYMWTSVFEVLDVSEHPWGADLVADIAERWPKGFAQLAYLDFVNSLCDEGEIAGHPFDTARGHEALRQLLAPPDEMFQGAARSAAVALAYLDPSVRGGLIALAERHVDVNVRIAAAGVHAQEGDADAIARLVKWASDPRYAEIAIGYLESAGAEGEVPEASGDDAFRAAAEMASWLAQPTEFNRPPDELVQVDARWLHWPPTNDRRRVWLFRYQYWPMTDDDASFEGLGMVGSVTFALTDEDTEDLPVAEAYGLHCAWELEMLEDYRAPPTRDARAGLRILRETNPGL